MPITVTAPRGELTTRGEREILPRLTAELIDVSGLTGNPFFETIVGGTVHLLEPENVYAGGKPAPVIMVELKLPAVGLPDLASRREFIERATAVVEELAVEGHDPHDTWINVLNAPDGAWGFDGRSWTNEALGAAISEAAAASA